MKYLYFFLCLVIASYAYAGKNLPKGGGDHIPKIDSLIANSIENKTFSGSVLVTKNKKVLYQKSYGIANAETSTVIDQKTSFSLSALTRTLTTSCVLKLVDQGKLDLNDNVKKFIPEFPFEGVTIRNFLRQNSDKDKDENEKCANVNISHERNDKNHAGCGDISMLDNNFELIEQKEDRREKYLNENYKMLTTIVERASGQSFKNYVHTNIFSPCSMPNSFVNDEENDINKAVGYKYSFLSEKFTPYNNNFEPQSTTNIYSNCDDLLNFTENYFSGKIISQELVMEATSSDKLAKATKFIFGGFGLLILGLCLTSRSGNKFLLSISAISLMTGTIMIWSGFYNKRHDIKDFAMGWERMIYNKEEVTYQTDNTGGSKNILWHEKSGLNIIILSNNNSCPNYELAKNISNIVHEQPHHLTDVPLASLYSKNLKKIKDIDLTIKKTVEEWHASKNEKYKYADVEEEKIQELGYELLSENKVPESIAAFNLNRLLSAAGWKSFNTYSDVIDNSEKTFNSIFNLGIYPDRNDESSRVYKLGEIKAN